MSKSLLAFDTDRIKSYVFATDKLKEIRGASAILDALNRVEMVEVVEKLGGKKIYANGGSGLFIIDSNLAAEAKMKVENLYQEKTGTASVTGVDMELPPDYKEGDNIQPYFQTLGYRLRAAKDSKIGLAMLVTHPYLHFCASCGTEYSNQEYNESGETTLLCASCVIKREKDWRIKDKEIPYIVQQAMANQHIALTGLWHYLIPALRQQQYPLEGYNRPDDLNNLADMSHPNNYIGLIYADGDSMGKALENLKPETDFKEFSETIDGSIYEAVAKAISKHLQPQGSTWPFDILLLGGDDLVMVTPADKVLEVGLTVMEQFSELTQQKQGAPLSLSVGIAIAHANYPFGQLRRLAESTLKFAKKEGAKRRQAGQEWEGGLLNFVVVSSANHLEFGEYYQEELVSTAEEVLASDKNLFRSLRPYSSEDFGKLIKHVRTTKALKTPRGRLEQLRSLLLQTRKQAMVDGVSLLFHWRSEKQRQAIQDIVAEFTPKPPEHGMLFPWYQIGPNGAEAMFLTPLLDLVEIYDFISEEAS